MSFWSQWPEHDQFLHWGHQPRWDLSWSRWQLAAWGPLCCWPGSATLWPAPHCVTTDQWKQLVTLSPFGSMARQTGSQSDSQSRHIWFTIKADWLTIKAPKLCFTRNVVTDSYHIKKKQRRKNILKRNCFYHYIIIIIELLLVFSLLT